MTRSSPDTLREPLLTTTVMSSPNALNNNNNNTVSRINHHSDNYIGDFEDDNSESPGSTVGQAVFNFTNGIVGAGAIGLGGAMAQSGGVVSIVTLLVFAVLTKLSLDMLVDLSIKYENNNNTHVQSSTAVKIRHHENSNSNNKGDKTERCTTTTIEQSTSVIATELMTPSTSYIVDCSSSETTNVHENQLVANDNIENLQAGSYEGLGKLAFGWSGQTIVSASKFLYSSGCLVAYVIVVKNNLNSAIISLIYGSHAAASNTLPDTYLSHFLQHDLWVTWTVGLLVMFPLCLMRDLTPLSRYSTVSVLAMLVIVGIVLYIYIVDGPTIRDDSVHDDYLMWWQVRPGFLQCLGTFVFTFVSQHTVHLLFDSLQPRCRTLSNWKFISSVTLTVATTISISVGLIVYVTFGLRTKSDIFQLYPSSRLMDGAKLLLSGTMLLTFPIPFLACREILIVTFYTPLDAVSDLLANSNNNINLDVEQEQQSATLSPLLSSASDIGGLYEIDDNENDCYSIYDIRSTVSLADLSILSSQAVAVAKNCLLPGDSKQLKLPYHVILTAKLWFVVTGLAIASPNLGDVLNLVGCATGTIIAFIMPACIAFKLEGYTHKAAIILLVGGVVGIVGTYYSVRQLFNDML